MMDKLRQFFQTRAGVATAGVLLLLALGVMVWVVRSVTTSDAEAFAGNRWFVDAQTGKPFRADLEAGMAFPIKAPSGGNTGYPAVMCYWTKDGKIRTEPYPVLLKSWVGKSGPTFCPDCGRLVSERPRLPMPGSKPPPTEAEYRQGRRGD